MRPGHRPDRLELSRRLEVIADRTARSGQRERADQLLAAAAHLRAKAHAVATPAARQDARDERSYRLGFGLLVSWVGVVLLVVAAVAGVR